MERSFWKEESGKGRSLARALRALEFSEFSVSSVRGIVV
jgi:hypothetical protein